MHTLIVSGEKLTLDDIALEYSPYLSTLFSTRLHVDRDHEGNIIFDEFPLDDMIKYIDYLMYGICKGLDNVLMDYMGHKGDYMLQWIRDHKHIRDLSLTHDVKREYVKIDERFIGINYVYDDDEYIFYSHKPEDIINRLKELKIKYIHDEDDKRDNIVHMYKYTRYQTTTHYINRGDIGISGPLGIVGWVPNFNPLMKSHCIPLYCSPCKTLIDVILEEELRHHTIVNKRINK